MKTTTDFQLVNVSKLIPYVNNARTHSKEQITKLRSSLREFGFINPIIIDKDFNVIAGHRVTYCKRLKLQNIGQKYTSGIVYIMTDISPFVGACSGGG